MKNFHVAGILLLAAVMAFSGCSTKKVKKVKLKSFNDSASYVVGANIGKRIRQNLKENNIEVNPEIFAKGFLAQILDTMDMFTEAQKAEIGEKFNKELRDNEMKRRKVEAEKNKKMGEAFLSENKKKEGVQVTADGLQYRIIKPGTGKSTHDTDMVNVYYTAKYFDGKVFGASEPSKIQTFSLRQMPKGFAEGLGLIKEGGKIEMWIPSDLAYGDEGYEDMIKPGTGLYFEVELVSIGKPAKGK